MVAHPRRNEALRRLSTRSVVYARIREAIVSVEMTPGQALSENELAAQYGVSRTPVREALIRLADDGLVEVVPQLGTFVSRISLEDVKEAQFIRESLERASLPQLVGAVSEADIARLRQLLDVQRAAMAAGDQRGWFTADEDLHRTLLEMAGHPNVWPIVHAAKAHLDRVRRLSLPEPHVLSDLTEQHAAIVDNVVAGAGKAADAVLTKHLRLVFEHLEPQQAHHPDYFLNVPERGEPVSDE